MLTINNTLDGYLKDVEILGNTIQDEEDLADIRSVGDKVEGQELYEIPVLSCGKNLWNYGDTKFVPKNADRWCNFEGTNELMYGNMTDKTSVKIHLKEGNYYVTYDVNNSKNIKGAQIVEIQEKSTYNIFNNVLSLQEGVYTIRIKNELATETVLKGFMICASDVATPYEPYQEDKLTILSPVQLEKVGDVADRIICKDGVWGVEKNIEKHILNGSEVWVKREMYYDFSRSNNPSYSHLSSLICNRFPEVNYREWDRGNKITGIDMIYGIRIRTENFDNETLDDFKNSLQENNVIVYYNIQQTPTFIPLPHDQQIKLRTFANKTNISFLTEIEGTIKAQVPKSLGATVNTHTEQISNLNKELDRVKKLEESTVSTVETESDFTTVEATSNGYFEDVKLEGKTLVNLASMTGAYIRKDTGNVLANSSVPLLQGLKANTTYTRIINVSKLNLGTIDRIRMYDSFTDVNGVYKQYPWSYITTTGVYMNTFTIGDADTTPVYKINPDALAFNGTTGAELEIDKMVILEGDHTHNPPNGYIKGLKSVGQSATTSEDGVDEIVVSSVNENLWNNGRITVDTNNVVPSNATSYVYLEKGEYRLSCKYTDDSDSTTHFRFNVKRNDRNGEVVLALGSMDRTISVDRNGLYYITIDRSSSYNGKFTSADIMLNKGTTPKPYTPHQSDKKRLLFYNEETQTWEKPVLREWDSIEKHSDGKYYYHKRSEEVAFDSNISISEGNNSNETNTTFSFRHRLASSSRPSGINKSLVICDKIPSTYYENMWVKDEVNVCVEDGNYIDFRILKSSLNDVSIEGVKTWLQANNVTVVYQLVQEKVYECTNIDLITYANETNYIVESGAIVPKSTLKVHNNISNVVSLLQKKVSLLENNITNYMIIQNRMQLASTYSADSVTFKVDYALCSEEVESYNEDLYNLILHNILVGKDNYDYDKMFTMVLDYASWNQISWEQFDILVGLMDIQHNPPVEDEVIEEIPNEIM